MGLASIGDDPDKMRRKLLIAGVAMLGMAGPANAQPVREVDCVYAQLVSNKAYALVGRTYLSDSEPADDVATAMLQLSDAVRACSEWSNLTSGQKAAMTDIGLYRSAIDYLGDVPWSEDDAAKAWYARVKSRPSFRPLLSEWLAGVPASRTYVEDRKSVV